MKFSSFIVGIFQVLVAIVWDSIDIEHFFIDSSVGQHHGELNVVTFLYSI